MDIQERIRQLKEIGERYIERVGKTANESMGVARHAYFELIKVLLGLSFAALPLLATVVGLGGRPIAQSLKPFLLGTVLSFLGSIVLGITALLFTAKTFRQNAHEHDKELRGFLEKCLASSYNPDVLEEYFKKGQEQMVQTGMFGELQLGWFFAQVATFLIGLSLFFWIIYKTV